MKEVWAARRDGGTRTPYQWSGLGGIFCFDLVLELELECGCGCRFGVWIGGWVGEGEDAGKVVGVFIELVLGSRGSGDGEADACAVVSLGRGLCLDVSSEASPLELKRSTL